MITSSKRLLRFAALARTGLAEGAQDRNDELQAGFENPPDSAKPRVRWHYYPPA